MSRIGSSKSNLPPKSGSDKEVQTGTGLSIGIASTSSKNLKNSINKSDDDNNINKKDKKGLLASQGASGMNKSSSRRRMIEIGESFRSKFSEINKKEEREKRGEEESNPSTPCGSGSGSGSGGVSFANDDRKKRTRPASLFAGTLERRRASRGPTIQPSELLASYKAKERIYGASCKGSFIFPYNWIPDEEKPPAVVTTSFDAVVHANAILNSAHTPHLHLSINGTSLSLPTSSTPLSEHNSPSNLPNSSTTSASTAGSTTPTLAIGDLSRSPTCPTPSPRRASVEIPQLHPPVDNIQLSPKLSPSSLADRSVTLNHVPTLNNSSQSLRQKPAVPLPTMEAMFSRLDIRFEGFPKWIAEMQSKVEERKKRAQRPATGPDGKVLYKTSSIRSITRPGQSPSTTSVTTSTGVVSTPSGTPTPGMTSTTPTSGSAITSSSLSSLPGVGGSSASSSSSSNSNSNTSSTSSTSTSLTNQLNKKSASNISSSLSSSLGLQKFTECTELERSFTRLKLTINPLFLLRKKLQLAHELQQQEAAAAALAASQPGRAPPSYPPPPPPAGNSASSRNNTPPTAHLLPTSSSSSALSSSLMPSSILPIPHNPSPLIQSSPTSSPQTSPTTTTTTSPSSPPTTSTSSSTNPT